MRGWVLVLVDGPDRVHQIVCTEPPAYLKKKGTLRQLLRSALKVAKIVYRFW